jgi:hypothetical protein
MCLLKGELMYDVLIALARNRLSALHQIACVT